MYLASSGHHWLIIQGNNYVCGMTENIINMEKEKNTYVKKIRRTHLQEIYLLESYSKGVKIPTDLLSKDKIYYVGSDTLEKIADSNPQIDDYRDERYHIVYSWDEVLEEFSFFKDYYYKHKHLIT